MAAQRSPQVEMDNAYDDENNLNQFSQLLRIEAGGFGTIYKATHLSSGVVYAVKTINMQRATANDHCFHVSREKRAMRHLCHRNIVKLHRAFKAYDQGIHYCYFIMEYCPNGDLYNYLQKLNNFRFRVNQFYSAELVLALEYIRSQNFVHRDLKPENLFLDRNFHLKLGDFGLSKRITDPRGRRTERRATRVGTICYVAPEVLDPDARTTFSTDLWGLGGVIFEFHTGDPPFHFPAEQYTIPGIEADIKAGRYRKMRISPEPRLQNIIDQLLTVAVTKRLGYNGYDEVKQHDFFREIDWVNLHRLVPPTWLEMGPDDPEPEYLDLKTPPMVPYRRYFTQPVTQDLPRRPPILNMRKEFGGGVKSSSSSSDDYPPGTAPHPLVLARKRAEEAARAAAATAITTQPSGAGPVRAPISSPEMSNIDRAMAALNPYGPEGGPDSPGDWMNMDMLYVPEEKSPENVWTYKRTITPPLVSSDSETSPEKGCSDMFCKCFNK